PACQGNTVNLTGSASGATSWSWSGPNAYSSTLQNPSITNIQPNQAGTYTLTATNVCGNTNATVNLVVNTVPTSVSASASPNPACQGNTVNLTGSASGATSWSWSGPNAYSSTLQNPSVTNIQPNQAGTYTLTATNVCGNTNATVNLVVNTVPTSVSASASPN